MKSGIQVDVTVLRLARSFINAPNTKQYAHQMARDYGIRQWKVGQTLARMERAGWLKSHVERVDPAKVGRGARRLYGLTPNGIEQVEALWSLLESTVSRS